MKSCARCDRHVKLSESVCPFCGAPFVEAAAPAAWGWAVGLVMLGAACGPGKGDGGTDGASSEATSGAESSGTSTGGDGATLTSAGEASGTSAEPTTGASSTGCSGAGCTDTTSGGAFIYGVPDGGFGDKDCDPWVQDCPPGEKCMPYSGDGDNSWESLKCVLVMENPGQVGDPCTVEGSGVSGIDSCDVGHMCWNVDDGTGEGTCVAMCKGSPDAPMCEPGTACTIANDGVLILCLPNCDPLIQDCSDTNVCIPNMGNFICVLDASGEEGQEYDVCEYANACDPGLFCAGPGNDSSGNCDQMAIGCCLSFCDLANPQCNSPAPVECVAWYDEGMAPPGYEDVGACVIPA